MKTHKRPHQSPGFTLFELLAVLGILAIIAGALFVNENSGQATLAAQRSAQIIVEALREAQNDALGAKIPPGFSSSPPGGWGVHFQSGNDPILFADMNCDHQYESAVIPTQCPNQSGTVADVLVRTIFLDQHAPVTALSCGSCNLDIAFLPPNPTVYINGIPAFPSTPDQTITITATYGSVIVKMIHINPIGLISVQ